MTIGTTMKSTNGLKDSEMRDDQTAWCVDNDINLDKMTDDDKFLYNLRWKED